MNPRRFGLALLGTLVALSVVTPPRSARAALHCASSSGPDDGMGAARRLYEEDRFVEAARAFEAIWRETGETGALYNAGMAREAAGVGHDALAVVAWQRYLTSAVEIDAAERADLERRILEAEGRMAPVELAFLRPGIATRIELQREGTPLADRVVVEPSAEARSLEIYLDPGSWSIVTDSDEARPSTSVLVVPSAGEAQRVVLGKALDLEEGPAREAPPPEVDRPPAPDRMRAGKIGVATVSGVAALTFVGLGTGLLVRGARGVDEELTAEGEDPSTTERAHASAALRWSRWMFDGSMAVAAGVGSATVAVTAAAGGRRRTFAIEAGIGGALAVGGAVGVVLTKRYRSIDQDSWDQSFERQHRDEMLAGATLGVGLGLGVAGLGGVIVTTVASRRGEAPSTAVVPLWQRGGGGIALVRRF